MCSGGEIVIEWSLAFSDRVRSSKYQHFLNIIPSKYHLCCQHNFRDDGSIALSFSTTQDHHYEEMVKIVDDYSSSTIYPYSKVIHRPHKSDMSSDKTDTPPSSPNVTTVIPIKNQTQATLFPKTGRKRKPQYSAQQLRKWQTENDIRRASAVAQKEEYNSRIQTDPVFKANELQRKNKLLKKNQAVKAARADRDKMNYLFGKVFGKDRWGDKCNEYFHRIGSKFMPVGNGKFFDGSNFFNNSTVLSKDDLYKVVSMTTNEDFHCKCMNCFDLGLRGKCIKSGMAALREGLPPYEDYDMWYRSLPLHVDFMMKVRDEEIHYKAPRSQQPDFPFIYVTWAIDAIDDDGEKKKDLPCMKL